MPTTSKTGLAVNYAFLLAPFLLDKVDLPCSLLSIQCILPIIYPILMDYSITAQVAVFFSILNNLLLGLSNEYILRVPTWYILFWTLLGLFFTTFVFPPLEIIAPTGPYKVGVVEGFIPPMEKLEGHKRNSTVKIRVLYPTMSASTSSSSSKYLPQGSRICTEFMEFGAPPPLKKFGFLLHYWTLIKSCFVDNAPLADCDEKFPVVIYSHGLGAVANLYSIQAGNLASSGKVVVLVEHQDRSAMITHNELGEEVNYDKSIVLLNVDGVDTPEYVRKRRAQCEVRCWEVQQATKYFIEMHKKGKQTEDFLQLLKGRLDVAKGVNIVGHSMGGATAINAAGRSPELYKSVVVHDPACDWVCDDVRIDLLSGTGQAGLGGFLSTKKVSKGLGECPLFFIYCEDWVDKNWGFSGVLFEKLEDGSLGKKGSKGAKLVSGTHNEFSDNSVIVPMWLGKAIRNCGPEPDKAHRVVSEMTRAFMDSFA